jgi:hypothetical protein
MTHSLLIQRVVFHVADGLGYLLCELAFKTDCRGPFAWTYRAGCWLYGNGTDAGIRSGELVENPACGAGSEAPMYVRRSH